MKQEYDWRFSLEKDFNFTGGLVPRLSELYAKRREEYGTKYGSASKRQQIKEVDNSTQLDLSRFNEDVFSEHQKKVAVILGAFYGIRGMKEMSNLLIGNIDHGVIEAGHEYAGKMYYGINDLTDKSCKITFTNTVARQTNHMRLPVLDENDPNDVAGCIGRYLKKVSPSQLRLFCKEASPKQKHHYGTMGWPNAQMSPHQPLGHNAMRDLMREASNDLGFDVAGHAFRRLFVSTLVNDGRVSAEESLASARHGSVAAQRPYQSRNNVSEANRFKALGINAPSSK